MSKQSDFILIDRSGSMSGLWTEALGSVNAYAKKLADDKVKTEITVAVFDSVGFDVIRNGILPSKWVDITDRDATPRGMTPLNDAIAKIVAMANKEDAKKTAIIIMTDGAENDSKEVDGKTAKKLLDGCRAKNWQVIFLGAQYEGVYQQGASYGAVQGQMVNSSVRNLSATMTAMASKRGLYGSGAAATMSFSDEEQEEAAKD